MGQNRTRTVLTQHGGTRFFIVASRIIIGRLLSKQVLCKPFGRWSGGGFEILHVGVKMATGQRHETLRLKRPLIGSQGQVSNREDITKRNHHHQRRRANKGGITSGLVLGEHLDRAESNLILPGGRTAATSLGEPFPAIRCREGGWRRRIFGHHWNHSRRLPVHASTTVVGKHLLHPGKVVGSN